jgi:hypothetical protein
MYIFLEQYSGLFVYFWAKMRLGGSVCEPKKFVHKHFSYIQFYYHVKCTHIILSLQEQHEVSACYHFHYHSCHVCCKCWQLYKSCEGG